MEEQQVVHEAIAQCDAERFYSTEDLHIEPNLSLCAALVLKQSINEEAIIQLRFGYIFMLCQYCAPEATINTFILKMD